MDKTKEALDELLSKIILLPARLIDKSGSSRILTTVGSAVLAYVVATQAGLDGWAAIATTLGVAAPGTVYTVAKTVQHVKQPVNNTATVVNSTVPNTDTNAPDSGTVPPIETWDEAEFHNEVVLPDVVSKYGVENPYTIFYTAQMKINMAKLSGKKRAVQYLLGLADDAVFERFSMYYSELVEYVQSDEFKKQCLGTDLYSYARRQSMSHYAIIRQYEAVARRLMELY